MEQCVNPNCAHLIDMSMCDESVSMGTPAVVVVTRCETIIARVVGKITLREGADGVLYPAVALTKC